MLRPLSLILLLSVLLIESSGAVIIDSKTGTGNLSAPPDDPGWIHVGKRSTRTAVYLGNGWAITAAHLGAGTLKIDGVNYPAVPGSEVAIIHNGSEIADIVLYRLNPVPPLPTLPIRSSQPAINDPVTMIGNGLDRGAATSFTIPPSSFVYHGYFLESTRDLRWGTNVVSNAGGDIQVLGRVSRAFASTFTRFLGDDECLAADGDSGGAVFIKNGSTWELAGIMVAVAAFQDQPPGIAAYENLTYMVDLSYYESQILDVITPLCGNGILTSDEECDDGNALDGDCCSSTCQFEANGSACDDGLFCNGSDTCDGAGVCQAGTVDPCEDSDVCTVSTCNEIDLCEQIFEPSPACFAQVPSSGPSGRLILLVSLAAIGAVLASQIAPPMRGDRLR